MVNLLCSVSTFALMRNLGRMTQLPPGFKHELQQHLHQHGHGHYDEVKGVPVLDFDQFCCGKLACSYTQSSKFDLQTLGAHGFAALIVSHFVGDLGPQW